MFSLKKNKIKNKKKPVSVPKRGHPSHPRCPEPGFQGGEEGPGASELHRNLNEGETPTRREARTESLKREFPRVLNPATREHSRADAAKTRRGPAQSRSRVSHGKLAGLQFRIPKRFSQPSREQPEPANRTKDAVAAPRMPPGSQRMVGSPGVVAPGWVAADSCLVAAYSSSSRPRLRPWPLPLAQVGSSTPLFGS